jgi:FlaA1/EpsC-like NDP-sugar epimerase
LRPGEKLNEALFSEAEEQVPTGHPRISATRGTFLPEDLDSQVSKLVVAAKHNSTDEVRDLLAALLPDYQPPAMAGVSAHDLFDELYASEF